MRFINVNRILLYGSTSFCYCWCLLLSFAVVHKQIIDYIIVLCFVHQSGLRSRDQTERKTILFLLITQFFVFELHKRRHIFDDNLRIEKNLLWILMTQRVYAYITKILWLLILTILQTRRLLIRPWFCFENKFKQKVKNLCISSRDMCMYWQCVQQKVACILLNLSKKVHFYPSHTRSQYQIFCRH